MYFIYILYSTKSDIYYVGHTNDLKRRFEEHNELSEDSFTSKQRRFAIKVEKMIKSQKSRRLVEKLVEGKDLQGILAQLVRVTDH
jgi:putative endonuclease